MFWHTVPFHNITLKFLKGWFQENSGEMSNLSIESVIMCNIPIDSIVYKQYIVWSLFYYNFYGVCHVSYIVHAFDF